MKKPGYELDIAVSNFQKVLVVQSFKPGYLYSALTNFVHKVLGKYLTGFIKKKINK